MNKTLQDELIDTLCNEAFDELLTQEFNPDGDDFSDDNKSEAENVEELGKNPNSRFRHFLSALTVCILCLIVFLCFQVIR